MGREGATATTTVVKDEPFEYEAFQNPRANGHYPHTLTICVGEPLCKELQISVCESLESTPDGLGSRQNGKKCFQRLESSERSKPCNGVLID